MDYEKHQCILAAVEALRSAGSWTGRTHVQKTLALAAALLGEKLPFEFVLYKYGPYSFDVDQEIAVMLTYDGIQSIPQGQYGPALKPGSGARFPETVGEMDGGTIETIKRVAAFVGNRDVAQLEALATAVWVRVRDGLNDDGEVARRLQNLKPHIQESDAAVGARDSRMFIEQVRS